MYHYIIHTIVYENSEGLPEWYAPQSAGQLGTAPEKGGKDEAFAICFS